MRKRGCWSTCLVFGVLSLLLIVGLVLAGSLIGGKLVSSRPIDHPSRWKQIGPVPEGAREIVEASYESVTVRAPSGKYYAYRQHEAAEDGTHWHRIDTPPSPTDDYHYDTDPFEETITPPGEVIAQFDVTYRPIPESTTHTRWVILDDGILWRWQHVNDMYSTLMKLLIGPICGLGLAVVVIVAAGIMTWASHKRRTTGDDLVKDEAGSADEPPSDLLLEPEHTEEEKPHESP